MDEKLQQEISSAGGKAAHVKGTAHQWTSDDARAAGLKGAAARRLNTAVGRLLRAGLAARASDGDPMTIVGGASESVCGGITAYSHPSFAIFADYGWYKAGTTHDGQIGNTKRFESLPQAVDYVLSKYGKS